MRVHIETERLILRPLEPDDAEAVFRWGGDPAVNKYMIYPLYHRAEDVRTWLESRNPDDPDVYDEGIVLKETGELIGSGGLTWHPERNAWEIGYNLRADQWGHGYTVEMLNALIAHIRKTRPVDAIDGIFAAENSKSRRVMEKMGMTYFLDTSFDKLDGSETFPAKYYRREFAKSAQEVISARRSYRGKYLPDPVPREDLQRILQSGLDAPSGCNRQTTSLTFRLQQADDQPDRGGRSRGAGEAARRDRSAGGGNRAGDDLRADPENQRVPEPLLRGTGLRRGDREHAAGRGGPGLPELLV